MLVLFKLKPDISKAQLAEWSELGAAMVGKIPGMDVLTHCCFGKMNSNTNKGLLKWDANPPLPVTAHRAQGYDMGLIAVLEKPEDVVTYGKHPAHQRYVSQALDAILVTS